MRKDKKRWFRGEERERERGELLKRKPQNAYLNIDPGNSRV